MFHEEERFTVMKRRFSIVVIAMLLVLGMAVPAFAATGGYTIGKVTYTEYTRDDAGKMQQSNIYSTKYKYNKKKDLTELVFGKYSGVQYDYKYKNGKKSTMTTNGGSWAGAKIYYNKKGQRTKRVWENSSTKYYYNAKGYVKKIQHNKPWPRDNRYKETWTYKYSGSKLKTATLKILNKSGKVIERQVCSFNNKGLLEERIHEYGPDSDNSGIKERSTYTYKYKNGMVKSVMKKTYGIDEEDGSESLQGQYKYSFTYTKTKIPAARYRMMMLNVIEESAFYGEDGPGTWF